MIIRSSIEPLESRIAPAGVVAVTYTQATGVLVITASDDLAHAIHVHPTGPTTFRIDSTDGTQVGTGSFMDETGKLTAVTYTGGNGDDFFQINNFKTLTTVTFDGKDGVDTLNVVDVTTTGDVNVKLGTQTVGAGQAGAFFGGQAVTIGGNIVADTGAGGFVVLNAITTTVKGAVTVTGGAGVDQLFVNGGTTSINKGIVFTGGAGDDLLSLNGGGSLTVGKAADGRAIVFDAGTENDTLSIFGAGAVNVLGKIQYDGGAGNNTTTVQADLLNVSGDFLVTGTTGDDTVNITSPVLKVGGDLRFTLGDGSNLVNLFPLSMTVSKTLGYQGGTGTDEFDLNGDGHTISGGLTIDVGDAPAGFFNTVQIAPRILKITALSPVLPGLSITGGAGDDNITVNPHTLNVTGTTVLNGGDGTNDLELTMENGTFSKDVQLTGGSGDDTMQFGLDTAVLKSNLTFVFGAGTNSLETRPDVMTITKDLRITGVGGDDTVHLDPVVLKLSGVADINLGDGTNDLEGYMVNASFGKTLTYHGGAGSDAINLTGTSLAVKGAVDLELFAGANGVDLEATNVKFGDAFTVNGGDGVNTVKLLNRSLTVTKATAITLGSGGNTVTLQAPVNSLGALTVTTAGGDDTVNLNGTKLSASGLVKFDLGAGDDTVNINSDALGLKKGLTVLGGADADKVNLVADGTITGDVNIDLGAATDANQSLFIAGNSGLPGILKITGALTLSSAATDGGTGNTEHIDVSDVTVTKAITTTAGAVDSIINFNNANTNSTFTLNSGAGNDTVHIETQGAFGPMTIAKATSINLGDGNDNLIIGVSHAAGSNDFVKFLGAVTVDGGTGTDSVNDLTVNFFGPGVPAAVVTNVP